MMAQPRSAQRPLLTQEQLKKKLEVSNFDPNAILRGAQLTIVGALRALQNPALFTSEHYKQAAIAVGVGIAIRLAIAIPVNLFFRLAHYKVDDAPRSLALRCFYGFSPS